MLECGHLGAALAVVSAALLILTIWVLVENPGASAKSIACRGSFLHGVASGDPQATGIVLWTRVTPANASADEALPVHWKVWLDDGTSADKARAIVEGDAHAQPQRDFTLKVDVQSDRFKPKVRYAFQFSHGCEQSAVGKFHLPPAEGEMLDSLKYAVFSCSNWRWGYFNAYGAAARESLDFWLHVGDFIYEHGENQFPTDPKFAARERLDPAHEAVSLEDYRKRYALYRSDPDLQRLSAAAPSITIWDDHEVANDVWKRGAAGHDVASDGDYASRRAAAMQVYHEWMPTRPHTNPWVGNVSDAPWMHWRRLDFGDLASLLVLETRHSSRTYSSMTRKMISDRIRKLLKLEGDLPPEEWSGSKLEKDLKALRAEVDAEMHRKEKTILGEEQLSWIGKQVHGSVNSGIRWRVIAQPLVIQERMTPDYEKALAEARKARGSDIATKWQDALKNATGLTDVEDKLDFLTTMAAGRYRINLAFDDFMGFIVDRMRLAAALRPASNSGTVIYGGDTHNAWAGTLRDDAGEVVAAEFDGMSVSSGGLEQWNPNLPPDLEAAAWETANANLLWADTHNRGFMLVRLGRDTQYVEYRGVDVRTAGSDESWCIAAFEVERDAIAATRKVSCCGDTHLRQGTNATSLLQAPMPIAMRSFHRAQAALRRGVPTSLST